MEKNSGRMGLEGIELVADGRKNGRERGCGDGEEGAVRACEMWRGFEVLR